MTIDEVPLKRDGFPSKFLDWRNKRRHAHLMTGKSVRERSISMLQNRYGYTREQATYQLDKYYSGTWLG